MKKKKTLILTALFLLIVTLASCSVNVIAPNGTSSTNANEYNAVIRALENFSYYNFDIDEGELSKLIVEYYRLKTGDKYSYYYTKEEYEALSDENIGKTYGIGISVVENTDKHCVEVVLVYKDSPADKAGLKTGDLITGVGNGDNVVEISSVGFETALNMLRGELGSACEFVLAPGGDTSAAKDMSVIREEYTMTPVIYGVSKTDTTIGIIMIAEFNLLTPVQFKSAMSDLLSRGCTRFVYDVRNNPGGDLESISAVLSYFIEKDGIIIRTKTNNDVWTTRYCVAKTQSISDYAGCSVTENEIAMYADYPAVVLVNGSTASAAELFTSAMKDYGLATIIGEKTYGKGCMQSILPMSLFGTAYTGAIRVTTQYYYPPLSDNYDGIGVSPDEGYEVILSDEAKNFNSFKLFYDYQSLDNQLTKAIEVLNNK